MHDEIRPMMSLKEICDVGEEQNRIQLVSERIYICSLMNFWGNIKHVCTEESIDKVVSEVSRISEHDSSGELVGMKFRHFRGLPVLIHLLCIQIEDISERYVPMMNFIRTSTIC